MGRRGVKYSRHEWGGNEVKKMWRDEEKIARR